MTIEELHQKWCPNGPGCTDCDLRDDLVQLIRGMFSHVNVRAMIPPSWVKHMVRLDTDPEFRMVRAAGSAEDPVCGVPYNRHPFDLVNTDEHGRAFMRIACDGVRVKL